MKRSGVVAGVVGLAGLAFPLVLSVTALSGAAGGAGCSAAPDFVPFVCAVSLDDGGGADGGDGGDSGEASSTLDGGALTDADADATLVGTPYYYARQITAADCTMAAITWIQCDDGIYARYTAVDSGLVTVDYYTAATGGFVAQVLYPSLSSAGQCTTGPSMFTPPGCAGSQVVCCPLDLDAGDADVTDAAPDSGCGF